MSKANKELVNKQIANYKEVRLSGLILKKMYSPKNIGDDLIIGFYPEYKGLEYHYFIRID